MPLDRDFQLSPHFTLGEFLTSESCPELAAQLNPTDAQLNSLRLLANSLLEPLRTAAADGQFGNYAGRVFAGLEITSGFRSPELNAALKTHGCSASATSQHLFGEAADMVLPGFPRNSAWAMFDWLRHSGIPFCQLIVYRAEKGAGFWRGNIHLSIDSRDPARPVGRRVLVHDSISKNPETGGYFWPVVAWLGMRRQWGA